MNNEQIKKNDLELAGVFINLHERLVQFAHYNHEELSPPAEHTLKTWLTKNDGQSHVEYAQRLTDQALHNQGAVL